MSPRTIAFVDASPAVGGATRTLQDVLEAVDGTRFRALAVCRPGTGVAPALRERGASVVELEMPTLTFAGGAAERARTAIGAVRTASRLTRLLRAERAALVHASGLASTLLAAVPARLTGVPLVWHAHDMLAPGRANSAVVRVAAGASRAIVCVSEACRARLLALGAPEGRCHLVLGGVRTPASPAVRPGNAGPPVLLALGTITPQKGQHVLVAAAPALLRDHPALRIDVVGEPMHPPDRDYLRRLEEDVRRTGLTESIRFLGFRRDVPSLLAGATVLVHPATAEETLGLAAMEAMAAGVPVVASRIGGLPEVVEDGVTGVLVAPGDVTGLVRAVNGLLDDAAARARMGQAGRRRVEERFAVGRMLRELDHVVEGILGEGMLRSGATPPAGS